MTSKPMGSSTDGAVIDAARERGMDPVDFLQARVDWEDAGIRAEFCNDFESYLAYTKANNAGHVRILHAVGKS